MLTVETRSTSHRHAVHSRIAVVLSIKPTALRIALGLDELEEVDHTVSNFDLRKIIPLARRHLGRGDRYVAVARKILKDEFKKVDRKERRDKLSSHLQRRREDNHGQLDVAIFGGHERDIFMCFGNPYPIAICLQLELSVLLRHVGLASLPSPGPGPM